MVKPKIFLLLFIVLSISHAQDYFNLIDHGFTKEIEIVAEKPKISEIEFNGQKYSLIILSNAENVSLLPNFLPFYNFLISSTANAKVDLIQYELDEIDLPYPLFEMRERSLPDGLEFIPDFASDGKIFDFVYLGKMRGVDLFSLLFFPFQVDGQRFENCQENQIKCRRKFI